MKKTLPNGFNWREGLGINLISFLYYYIKFIRRVSSCFDIPLPRATKTIIQMTAKLKASSNLRDMKLSGGDQGALRCNTRALDDESAKC